MNDEQKAQALALYRNARIKAAYAGIRTTEISVTEADGKRWWTPVPNLADETGAVEGVLHRVLERLVGETVEISDHSRAMDAVESWIPWARSQRMLVATENFRGYPTRLEAIVAALLEVTT